MAELAQTVIAESKDGYPELEDKKEFILQVLSQEEGKFDKTIDQGLTHSDTDAGRVRSVRSQRTERC